MKKAQLFIVLFIVVIMISSVIGFVYTNPNSDQNINSFNYNNFKFDLTSNGKYQVNVNDKNFIFDYLPGDLKDIELLNFNLKDDKYYLITNYSEKDQNMDYNLNKLGYTLNLLGIKTVLACYNEEECNLDLPIKDCNNDAFYLKKSNINKVYLENKCIIIEGNPVSMSKMIDKVNLKLVGI